MTDDKKTQPMDATAPEGDAPEMYKPSERNTYAMEQLITEVEALFPGTIYTVSHRNQRGVAFDVLFSPLPDEDTDVRTLLVLMGDSAYNEDPRIEEVVSDQEGVLVRFRNDPRIMDDRTEFGLAEAWEVLSGDEVEMPPAILHIPTELSFPGGFDAEHDGPSL